MAEKKVVRWHVVCGETRVTLICRMSGELTAYCADLSVDEARTLAAHVREMADVLAERLAEGKAGG